jgi:hypothetical protein
LDQLRNRLLPRCHAPSRQVGPTAAPVDGRAFFSHKEEQAHFALWAVLKSPLFIAADLRQLSPSTRAVLMAKEVIAVNQDPLGVAGDLVWKQGAKEVGRLSSAAAALQHRLKCAARVAVCHFARQCWVSFSGD